MRARAFVRSPGRMMPTLPSGPCAKSPTSWVRANAAIGVGARRRRRVHDYRGGSVVVAVRDGLAIADLRTTLIISRPYRFPQTGITRFRRATRCVMETYDVLPKVVSRADRRPISESSFRFEHAAQRAFKELAERVGDRDPGRVAGVAQPLVSVHVGLDDRVLPSWAWCIERKYNPPMDVPVFLPLRGRARSKGSQPRPYCVQADSAARSRIRRAGPRLPPSQLALRRALAPEPSPLLAANSQKGACALEPSSDRRGGCSAPSGR